MEESILSAGIDVGTSTTQLIFSRLTIRNTSQFGAVPKIEIIDKKVIYRSEAYFTPLHSPFEIDGEAVKKLILSEYQKAGIRPEEVETGAVIITGESSRKQNAKEVVRALSMLAGSFVVAAAGPNLEAILAGKGAGADVLSLQTQKLVANLDIGGGTTNICFFENGKVVDTACLDVGGRLIKVEQKKITYLAPKIERLAQKMKLSFQIGESVECGSDLKKSKLYQLVQGMVLILEQAVLLSPKGPMLEEMKTNQLITMDKSPDIITLSGGVADCVRKEEADLYAYGDIGVLLGMAIRESDVLMGKMQEGKETLRATVIGAGNYSMEVSGSTIEYCNCTFPMKNVPVITFELEEADLVDLHHSIISEIKRWREECETEVGFAIATTGIRCPSFSQIETMAKEIALAIRQERKKDDALIMILETDMAKALGQALKREFPKDTPILCIDGISLNNGNYIDLGLPLASGCVIPVVVKTLVFEP